MPPLVGSLCWLCSARHPWITSTVPSSRLIGKAIRCTWLHTRICCRIPGAWDVRAALRSNCEQTWSHRLVMGHCSPQVGDDHSIGVTPASRESVQLAFVTALQHLP